MFDHLKPVILFDIDSGGSGGSSEGEGEGGGAPELPRAAYNSDADIPSSLKSLYAQGDDGVWVLSPAPAELMVGDEVRYYAVENVAGLKSALNKERSEADKLRRRLGEYTDTSGKHIEPVAAIKAMKKAEELSRIDPEKQADRLAEEKARTRIESITHELTGEIQKRDQRIGTLTGQLESQLITNAATKAIVDARGSLELLLPVVKGRAKMKESETGFEVEILDANGQPAYRHDSVAGMIPQTFSGLLKQLRSNESYARAFDGSGHSGSGSSGSATSRPTQTTRDGKKIISIDDAEGLQNNLEAIAKGEAEVTGYGVD